MTGRGKSHILRVMGTTLKGVILIIHPLLVLTADQVLQFQDWNDQNVLHRLRICFTTIPR